MMMSDGAPIISMIITEEEERVRTIDRSHYETYLRGVGGAGKVGVDLFGLVLVQ